MSVAMTGLSANAAVDVVWTVTVAIIGALAGFLVGTWRSDAFWREQVAWYRTSYKTAMSGWDGALKSSKEALASAVEARVELQALRTLRATGFAELERRAGVSLEAIIQAQLTEIMRRDSKTKTDD